MRLIPTGFAITAIGLMGACAHNDVHYGRLIEEGCFGDAPATFRAQAESLARRRYRSLERQEKFQYYYYQGYENALQSIAMRQYARSLDPWDPAQPGLDAGRAAAIADIKAGTLRARLEDFGYELLEASGCYRCGFHESRLVLDGRYPGVCMKIGGVEVRFGVALKGPIKIGRNERQGLYLREGDGPIRPLNTVPKIIVRAA